MRAVIILTLVKFDFTCGIVTGRIIYCLLEHSYDCRGKDAKGNDDRSFLKLPPLVAPVKCSLLPLSNGAPEFDDPIAALQVSWLAPVRGASNRARRC